MAWMIPVAMIASAVITAAAASKSAAAQRAGGQAGLDTSYYNAATADNNATIAQQNADWATASGNAEGEKQQLKNRAEMGSTLANQGASGLDINSGSSQEVRDSSGLLGRLDVATIRSNAARQAYGYQNQAASFKSQAQLDRMAGDNALQAGNINADATVLGAVGGAAGNFAKYAQSSGFGSSDSGGGGNAPAGQSVLDVSDSYYGGSGGEVNVGAG